MAKEKRDKIKVKPITQKKLDKGFASEVDLSSLSDKINTALNHEGYVYGLFREGKCWGIYIFDQVRTAYLPYKVPTGVRSILMLTKKEIHTSLKKEIKSIESELLIEAQEHVFTEEVDGILWSRHLIYRADVHNKSLIYISGILVGFALGIVLGRTMFHSWFIGLCLALIFTCVGLLFAGTIHYEQMMKRIKLEELV